jgi:hypothetical protein
MSTRNNDPTNGRVYGGDSGLVHIKDGNRVAMGIHTAMFLDDSMRSAAFADGDRTLEQADNQNLCPGCYMVALFNAAVHLAQQNGQSLDELGRSMSEAFGMLAKNENPTALYIESIIVQLDADGERGFYAEYSTAQLIGMGM